MVDVLFNDTPNIFMVENVLFNDTQNTFMVGNVLFNDTSNTFYLKFYGVEYIVKDHSDKKK